MTTAAVIVAAGRGLRAGGEIPKQYQALAGKPVLARSILAFTGHPEVTTVQVVINPEDAALFETLIEPHLTDHAVQICHGGAERSDSVLAGLRALDGARISHVLIHDAARPLIDAALISRVLTAMRATGAAAPALTVTDTLWQGTGDRVTGALDRTGLYRAQTPQGFALDAILSAHETSKDALTDDVQVGLAAGLDITIVAGNERNIKITEASDFNRAARFLGEHMDIRTGNGFDVHAFETGDHVVLCGIKIPHDHALKGHSDADVAMHAVTDAIYGALGQGDIGQWFPPSDPQWKGAASDVFLTHAVDLALGEGFNITHVDCTIICEMPKIGPHAATMRANMAGLLRIDESRVSVKATTSEQLGFTGRKEGIAALATATLMKT